MPPEQLATSSASPEPQPDISPAEMEIVSQAMAMAEDMRRLGTLLDSASEALLHNFVQTAKSLDQGLSCVEVGSCVAEKLREARTHIDAAITALQFGDMASQLLGHTVNRLRLVSGLGRAYAQGQSAQTEGGGMRPNPVTQKEMDVGSVDLF
jgi:hypothetical protein